MADALMGNTGQNRAGTASGPGRARRSEIGWTLEVSCRSAPSTSSEQRHVGLHIERTLHRNNEVSICMDGLRNQDCADGECRAITGIQDVTQGAAST